MKSWLLNKLTVIVLLSCVLSMYLLSFYFNCTVIHLQRIIVGDARVTNNTKQILFWNTMFGDESFYMGKGDIFADCPVNDCYATHDRSYADLTEFDAVLFHGNELELRDLPSKRSRKQWYVFVNLESPANRPLAEQFFEDFFNLTMTYRLDSDLVWSYGTVRDIDTGLIVAPSSNVDWTTFYNRSGEATRERLELSNTIGGKKKPIIWFVSNCVAKSGRKEFVDELSKHINVDVYGKCGDMYCPRSKDCFTDVVEPDYFFYLSFENSLCDDYVTEKLYNALRYNVVPIVYGGANYSHFAPPKSYINVFDFDTPKDLAIHLKSLMENPLEYSRYFEWKKRYRIDDGIRPMVCNLCKFLHERRESQTYNPLSDWYSRAKCSLQNLLRYRNYLSGNAFQR